MKTNLKFMLIIATVFWNLTSCTVDVVDSPDPGLIRLFLQADNSDTSITIIGDDYLVDSTFTFVVKVQEARAYADTIYTCLFPTIYDNMDYGKEYDLLIRNNNRYEKYLIYEYFAPPGSYSKIELSINPVKIKIGNFGSIPIQIPPGKSSLETIDYNFDVEENAITEIYMVLPVFQSIVRYMDIFYFDPKLAISGSEIIKWKN